VHVSAAARCTVLPRALLHALQTSSSASPAAAASCSLTVSLTYFGKNANDARAKSVTERDTAAAINKPQGMCQYGVCAAVETASKGAATVTSAAANTTKSFTDGTVCRVTTGGNYAQPKLQPWFQQQYMQAGVTETT
jgi:2-C-methyl-D-erythritol 4-phosphate cytidylyltransferase